MKEGPSIGKGAFSYNPSFERIGCPSNPNTDDSEAKNLILVYHEYSAQYSVGCAALSELQTLAQYSARSTVRRRALVEADQITLCRTQRRRTCAGLRRTCFRVPNVLQRPNAGARLLSRLRNGRVCRRVEALEEFEAGGDVSEACRCIGDLDMLFFHHEVVKKAIVMAMEKQNENLLDLLQECANEGLITVNQMSKGFTRVAHSMDDLALDIPDAKEKFVRYAEKAKSQSWLRSSFNMGFKSQLNIGSHEYVNGSC